MLTLRGGGFLDSSRYPKEVNQAQTVVPWAINLHPSCKIFVAALYLDHEEHYMLGMSILLIGDSFTALFLYPQREQRWLEGKVFPTFTSVLPNHCALYSSMKTNSDQDASVMDFANIGFFTMFSTCKSSVLITWFS
jgi:hypothetical protein